MLHETVSIVGFMENTTYILKFNGGSKRKKKSNQFKTQNKCLRVNFTSTSIFERKVKEVFGCQNCNILMTKYNSYKN